MSIPLEVATLFLREMQQRGFPVNFNEDGSFLVKIDHLEMSISLENLIKEYATDRDPQRITNFVEQIMTAAQPLPPWSEAQKRVYFMAEPADYDFDNSLFEPISEQLCKVLVCLLPDDSGILWITPEILEEWGQTQETVENIAEFNLAELLEKTKLHVRKFDKYHLGMFITPSVLKASLIFSPNLKEIVEPKLGWPIFAIVPCRDFCYLIPEKDSELLERVAPVVVSEYYGRGYPISTEIYHISDEGIDALGSFETDHEEDLWLDDYDDEA